MRGEFDKWAFEYWKIKYAPHLNFIDQILSPYFSKDIKAWSPGTKSRIKMARNALVLSGSEASKNMNQTQQAFSKLEVNETKGQVTLLSLYQAAEAMECELVFGIRPKNSKSFCRRLWDQLNYYEQNNPVSLPPMDEDQFPMQAVKRWAWIVNRHTKKQKSIKEIGINRQQPLKRIFDR